MIKIVLSESEVAAASSLGVKRHRCRERRENGGDPIEGFRDNGGTHDRRNAVGAIAEYAVAKHVGPDALRDWVETKAYSDEGGGGIPCDVGSNIHVRSTASKSPNTRLIVHPYDPDVGCFVFVVWDEETRTATIHGWQWGRNCKRPAFWDDKSPGFRERDHKGRSRAAYCVPRDRLFPIETLPEYVCRVSTTSAPTPS